MKAVRIVKVYSLIVSCSASGFAWLWEDPIGPLLDNRPLA